MSSATITARSTRRAWSAVALFTLFGVAGVWIRLDQPMAWILPQIIAYTALVVQTFFSVRRFSQALDASHPLQRIVDLMLVGAYAGMAWSFAEPVQFLLFFAAMFAIAVIKYASRPATDMVHVRPLRKKATANALGCVACLVAVGITSQDATLGAWTWAIAFVLIDLYVLGPGKLYA
jgi:hypothetical protein